jgi:hypothetical protein
MRHGPDTRGSPLTRATTLALALIVVDLAGCGGKDAGGGFGQAKYKKARADESAGLVVTCGNEQPQTAATAAPAAAGAAPTYAGAIKALLDAQCVSCHTAGVTAPDLSTEAGAKAQAARIQARVDDGTMPPGGLNAADKAAIDAWVAGGAALKLADEPAEKCLEDGPALDDSIYIPLLQSTDSCKAQNHLFDREKAACSEYVIADYACDRAGIVAAFAATGYQIEDTINRSLGTSDADKGEGFVIDQCGRTADGKPVALLYKKTSRDGAPRLRMRTLIQQ